MKSKIYEWTSEVFGFASQGHKLEQMFLNSFQGYIWFISCMFQAFSIIIMESVMGRLLGNPEKRDFFEDQIHDFDHGNSFFILISSLASLFCKFTSMLSHCKMFMINIFQSMHDVRFSVGQLQYTTTLFCQAGIFKQNQRTSSKTEGKSWSWTKGIAFKTVWK